MLVAVIGYNTSITAGDDAAHELAMIAHASGSGAYIYLVFLACGGDVYTSKDSKRRGVVLCKQLSLITCC